MNERRKVWTIRALNWKAFQHYKDREPPWIKLHRKLLDKPEWRRLSTLGGKLLVDLWMLAAGDDAGDVTMRLGDLGYRLRITVPRLARGLLELVKADFVELSPHMLADASAALANAVPETETEQRQRTTKSVASPPRGDA